MTTSSRSLHSWGGSEARQCTARTPQGALLQTSAMPVFGYAFCDCLLGPYPYFQCFERCRRVSEDKEPAAGRETFLGARFLGGPMIRGAGRLVGLAVPLAVGPRTVFAFLLWGLGDLGAGFASLRWGLGDLGAGFVFFALGARGSGSWLPPTPIMFVWVYGYCFADCNGWERVGIS